MKQILLVLFICLSLSLHGQTTVEIINNNDVDIYCATVSYNYQNQSWDSRGWYKVNAYSTRKLDFGDYAHQYIYIHGNAMKNNTRLRWGKGITACVDYDQTFHFKAVDKIKNCQEKETFTKLNVDRGQLVKYYLN